jgi:amino acid transporter
MRRESIHDVNIPAGMTEKSRGSMTKDDGLDLAASRSIDEVQAIEMQEGKHGQFHRSFTPRQVHVSPIIQNHSLH